jgi:hypothetical protein
MSAETPVFTQHPETASGIKQPWYVYFDHHCHTIASDGKNTLPEMAEAAINKGLNILVISDHIWEGKKWETDLQKIEKQDEKYQDYIQSQKNQLAVIRGCEATTRKWHLVVFGLDNYRILEQYFDRSRQSFDPFKLKNILSFARTNGLWTVAAHPLLTNGFHGMSLATLEKHADQLDAMEINNGEFRRRLPRPVYKLWTHYAEIIAGQLGLRPLSGSDAHRAKHIGMGTEAVIDREPDEPPHSGPPDLKTIMKPGVVYRPYIPKK